MISRETHKSHRSILLLLLLILNIIASIFHYTDNLIYFDTYPEPDWFSPYLTDSIWLLMTPLGIAGVWFYWQMKFRLAYIGLYSYALLNQFTLGHYLVSPIWELSIKMNTLILLESFLAIPLLFFVLWSQFILREYQNVQLGETEI